MHLSSCLHPKIIYNPYTHESIQVPCGKCSACANIRAKRWVDKMNQESRCHKYAFNLYLSYDDEHCPYYQIVGEYLLEQQPRFFKKFTFEEICIPLNELNFEHDYDFNYLVDRCNYHIGIPHASVRDIQLFKKRLNKSLRRYTGQYRNFRSAICAEYGPSSFRGHYHGIIWCDDERAAKNIAKCVSECWPYGHSDCNVPKSSATALAGYVAQYLNRPSHLPSIYAHPSLSPFFLTSKQPPLGSLFESSQEVREIFFNGTCERVERAIKSGQITLVNVPLSPTFKARIFPKCPRYSELSDFERTKLYRCGLDEDGEPFSRFGYFKFKLRQRLGYTGVYYDDENHNDSWLHYFINLITDHFTNDAPLVALYRASSRIYWQSKVFGITFDEYLLHIFKFYENYEHYQLKKFYEFQQDYTQSYPVKDLVYAYPLYVQALNKKIPWLSLKYDLNKATEFNLYKDNMEYIFIESHKRCKQNGYFKKLAIRDGVLLNILNSYHNAKKRNEINEAKSDTWTQRLRYVPQGRKFYKLWRTPARFVSRYSPQWKV